MEKTSFAFPSGSSGRKTPMASTSIWYRQLDTRGWGSSRRYSFNRPGSKVGKGVRQTKSIKGTIGISPVTTFMSGTFADDRSTISGASSKAIRSILFLESAPHSL